MRATLVSALPIVRLAGTLFMAWKLLCLVANSPYPAMVVLTESMMPAFQPGDVIILWNRTEYVQVGDIPVIWFTGNPLPMVHRVSKTAFE
ncbi:signal peptidase I [Colletotrichum karsti]|uniref:Signal peptidase complex catalytic subunit SEC11 n=1 Tax=Colletotrichum karsti TaxID=1095194 RepID=A0A9P6LIF6_9PEZI|nr:signal peptidase I [Colletotrichum karsti]KAF9877274.1 signal peptidase I [Colletotrichum karsti]